MKTPLQELIQYESDLTHMFDSDVRVAGAILEYIRTNKKDMLEKEKEVIEMPIVNGGNWDEVLQPRFENYYNETFNNKE
jgi:hypothetical protein